MRPLIVLLIAANAASAAPTIRWINRFGDPKTGQVAEVIAESAREIKVRFEDGAVKTIPVLRLLEFARESAREQDLLDARRDVSAGLRLGAARKVLDRYAKEGKPEWTREYADAARAVLAQRAGEKDASQRVERFLKDHPKSRFVSALHLARARLVALHTKREDLLKKAFHDAYDRIEAAGGPLQLAFDALGEAALISAERNPEDTGILDRVYERMLKVTEAKGGDLLYLASAEVAWARIQLTYHRRVGASVMKLGKKPTGPRLEVSRIIRGTAMLDAHAELRADLHDELGRLAEACGDRAAARAAWTLARDFARRLPDPRRLRAIEAALKRAAG